VTTALILAIEPDRWRASQLKSIARQVSAELQLADSVAGALTALDERLPDLILTPALLSARDDVALTERLRGLGDAAAHIQTLTIPILEPADMTLFGSGVFGTPRRRTPSMGCAADTFAEQVRIYLDRAAEARREAAPPIPSGSRLDTASADDSPAEAEPSAAADDVLVAPDSAGSAEESFDGIDESLALAEESPAPSAYHPPSLEEFDLDAFISEELLNRDTLPSVSVPIPVGPAGEAPTIIIRRVSEQLLNCDPVRSVAVPSPVGPALEAPTIVIRGAVWTSLSATPEDLLGFPPETPSGIVPPKSAPTSKALPNVVSKGTADVASVNGLEVDDDWESFNPAQPRFSALMAKLDEIAAGGWCDDTE
jgi:hypothetical protein